LEGLKTGITIEEDGIKFYSNAAEKTQDPAGKRTLEFLAKEEKRHKEFLESLLKSVEDKENPEKIIEKHIGKPKIFPKEEEFSEKIKAGRQDKEILEEAKKVEERSINYYAGLSNKVGEKEKKIFEILVGEERKHKEWIEYMEEALEIHGYWQGVEKYFELEG